MLREQALLATDEGGIGLSLDALAASFREANRWLDGQRDLLGPFDLDLQPRLPAARAARQESPLQSPLRHDRRRVVMTQCSKSPRASGSRRTLQRGNASGKLFTALLVLALLGLRQLAGVPRPGQIRKE